MEDEKSRIPYAYHTYTLLPRPIRGADRVASTRVTADFYTHLSGRESEVYTRYTRMHIKSSIGTR
jgi:hypothetical protein